MLDQYGTDFFGWETPKSLFFDDLGGFDFWWNWERNLWHYKGDFVNTIAIPPLSPAYADVTEQRCKYADYLIPDPANVSATVLCLHLVWPVRTLDELMIRLQKVIPAKDPIEYINIAVKEAKKRAKEDDDRRRKKGDSGRGVRTRSR